MALGTSVSANARPARRTARPRSASALDGAEIVMINDASIGRGGATGLALLAAEELAGRGHRVRFLAGDTGENAALADKGVRFWGAGGSHILNISAARSALHGLHNAPVLERLAAQIARNDHPRAVYHVHGWSKILSPGVFRVLRPVMDRVVVHAHDYFLACPNGAFWDYQSKAHCTRTPLSPSCLATACDRRSSLQKLWRAARTSALYRAFPRGATLPEIVLIHPGMIAGFNRSGYAPDRLRVLRNPVVPFSATPIAAQKNTAVAFVGRLDAEKGALDLAEACQAANLPLMVIGEGPQASAIAATGATLHGWQDRNSIGALLQTARMLVMPSRYPEPFGLVAVEALGSGLPVIATQSALLAPEIAAADAGCAVNLAQPGALAQTLTRMATDDALIARQSANAPAAAQALSTSLSGWLDGLEAAYARALHRAAAATAQSA